VPTDRGLTSPGIVEWKKRRLLPGAFSRGCRAREDDYFPLGDKAFPYGHGFFVSSPFFTGAAPSGHWEFPLFFSRDRLFYLDSPFSSVVFLSIRESPPVEYPIPPHFPVPVPDSNSKHPWDIPSTPTQVAGSFPLL